MPHIPYEASAPPAPGIDARTGEEPRLPGAPAPRASAPPDEASAGPDDSVGATQDEGLVPALSVAGAARGLGVAPATLRSWERRYGLGPSHHTPGGHRRYGAEDLRRLQVMHRLVRAGVPAAEAARAALGTSVASTPEPTGPFAALLAPQGSSAGAAGAAASRVMPAPGRPGRATSGTPTGAPTPGPTRDAGTTPIGPGRVSSGGGRVLPLPRGSQAARGLARSAMSLDVVSTGQVLARSLVERGAVPTWEELVRPVMGAIGDRWQRTGRGVEIEHSFSVVVGTQLAQHAAQLPRAVNDRPVLLASVPEEMHDLPLCALQAALADLGIRGHMLGARTPPEALDDAVRRLGPPVVFLWAQLGVQALPTIPAVRPLPALIVGGPGFEGVVTREPVAVSLVDGVALVRLAMGL